MNGIYHVDPNLKTQLFSRLYRKVILDTCLLVVILIGYSLMIFFSNNRNYQEKSFVISVGVNIVVAIIFYLRRRSGIFDLIKMYEVEIQGNEIKFNPVPHNKIQFLNISRIDKIQDQKNDYIIYLKKRNFLDGRIRIVVPKEISNSGSIIQYLEEKSKER